MTLVFDSYAWIEFFLGSEKGAKVKELIEGDEDIITPTIVLAEIANKYYREGEEEKIVIERISIIRDASTVRYIDDAILRKLQEAREVLIENKKRLKLRRDPSLADYIVYAISIAEKARIVTGDDHFKGLNVIFLE
ncbi:MAG: PIN domain-containing protein [Candidatus Korarchaeota archaeon]|nr:PIN domain-containing protein [Candidatus Korarchaeota archaeon]